MQSRLVSLLAILAFCSLSLSVATAASPLRQHHQHLRRETRSSRRHLEPRVASPYLGVGLAANPKVKTWKVKSDKNASSPPISSAIEPVPIRTFESIVAADEDGNTYRKRDNFPSSPHVVPLTPLRKPDFGASDGLHPMMYYQQHVNRGLARLAHMTGRALDPQILEANLKRRWQSLDLPLDALKLRKRGLFSDLLGEERMKDARKGGRRGDTKLSNGNLTKQKNNKQEAGSEAVGAVSTVTTTVVEVVTVDAPAEEVSQSTAVATNNEQSVTESNVITKSAEKTQLTRAAESSQVEKRSVADKSAVATTSAAVSSASQVSELSDPASSTLATAAAQPAAFRDGFVKRFLKTDSARLARRQDQDGTVGDGMNVDDPQGFSEIELDAILNNSETQGPEDVGNVLGLDIQSNDVGYFADISIGTPPRAFKMLIDSGSADTWVPSQVCQTCGNHQILGSRTSSTFRASNQAFQVTYGSGDVQGVIIQDTMQIGNLSLAAQVFGVTTAESPEFGDDGTLFDGLLGTAQSILSNQRVLTPIEALGRAGDVASSAMGYALGRVADGENDGTVTFGGINLAQIDGKLTEVPNVSEVGFWEGAIDDVTVDGQSLDLAGRSAILDTGTTLLLLPENDAAAIHAQIPGSRADGQGGFIIPCNTQSSVAFTFGGTSFAIDPRDLAFVPLDGNDLNGDCQSGISIGAIGKPTQWLVGDVFLKSTYFATDVDSNSMGIGKRARSTTGIPDEPVVAAVMLQNNGAARQQLVQQTLLVVACTSLCIILTAL